MPEIARTLRVEGTPKRTREHRIADLSAHYVAGFVLRKGYTVAGHRHDYGYDLALSTGDYRYGDDGELEPDSIKIQLKTTDNVKALNDGKTISLGGIERRHILLWRQEHMPVSCSGSESILVASSTIFEILRVYNGRTSGDKCVTLASHYRSCDRFTKRDCPQPGRVFRRCATGDSRESDGDSPKVQWEVVWGKEETGYGIRKGYYRGRGIGLRLR